MRITKKFIIITLFLFILFFQLSIHPPTVNAQTVSPSPASNDEYIKAQYEFLKGQTERFQDQMDSETTQLYARVDAERNAFYQQLTLGLTILGLILGGSIIAGVIGFYKSIAAIRRKAESTLEEQIQKNQAETIRQARKEVRQLFVNEFGLNRHIIVVADSSRQSTFENTEKKLLSKKGFTNISIVGPMDTIPSGDLVIFVYNDDLNSQLDTVVEQLEELQEQTPLIVYYPGRVENQKVGKYPYHSFANSPMTLISWVVTMITSTIGTNNS